MAGGEFRLGTDSIYMANQCHNQNAKSTIISPITWLHFSGHFPGMQSNSNLYRFGKREVRFSYGDWEYFNPSRATATIAKAHRMPRGPTLDQVIVSRVLTA